MPTAKSFIFSVKLTLWKSGHKLKGVSGTLVSVPLLILCIYCTLLLTSVFSQLYIGGFCLHIFSNLTVVLLWGRVYKG